MFYESFVCAITNIVFCINTLYSFFYIKNTYRNVIVMLLFNLVNIHVFDYHSYHMFSLILCRHVRVCARLRARVLVCAFACVRACVCVHACVRL